MYQKLGRLQVNTRGKGLVEVTREVAGWLDGQLRGQASGEGDGLLTIFCRHTSASLVIQENADPDVRADLADAFEALAPEDPRRYRHSVEGPDDMPAHIRAALTQSHLAIPVERGRPLLGAWQGIFLFEHRSAPHRRELALHFLGA